MEFISHIHLACAMINLFMAYVVISRGYRSVLNRITAHLFLSFAIWSGGLVVVHNSSVSAKTAQLFLDLSSIGGISALPIFLYFAMIFCDGFRSHRKKIAVALAAVSLVFVFIQFKDHSLQQITSLHSYGWAFAMRFPSLWPHAFIAFSSVCTLLGIGLLIHFHFTKADVVRRRQTRLMFICWILLFILICITTPMARITGNFPFITDTVFMLWAIAIVYSMTRYRLYELTARNAAEKIIETMPDGLLMIDNEGIIVSANPSAFALIEPSGLLIKGRSIRDVFPDDNLFWFTGEPDSQLDMTETVCVTAGVGVPVLLSRSFLKDDAGVVRGMVCVFRDISAIKNAETALRESESRYRAIFENIQDIYFETLVDGTIIQISPSVSTVAQYKREELIGRPVQTLYPIANERGTLLSHLTTYGKVSDFEIHLSDKNGEVHPCSITCLLMRDSAGAPYKIAGTLRDISERKSMESALVMARDSLERKVNERTEQLQKANKELDEAWIRAETANRAKSQFLATITHELRTPLNGVIGMADLLLDSPLSDQQRKYSDIIRAGGSALLSIVNTVLDFSKLEAGKVELEITDFDLRKVIDDITGILTPQSRDKKIALLCTIDPAVPHQLMGDPDRLRQIILNLASNAVKFTTAGQVTITVGVESMQDANVALRFAVSDTGIGIPENIRKTIFSPFIQGDGSFTRRYGGTGLGLTIAQQLAELMGSTIEVTSEVGAGSTFWFSAAFGKKPDRGSKPADSASSVQKLKILVAEDDHTNRAFLQVVLASLGYSADLVSDGSEALSTLRKNRYDLVLMDCHLPDMDGFETTRQIRLSVSGATPCTVPVIAITGDLDDDTIENVRNAGMNEFLGKPFRKGDLDLLIRTVMAKHGSGPAAPLPAVKDAADTDKSTWNEKEFLERAMNDTALARTIIAGFTKDIPVQIGILKNSIDKQDSGAIVATAHRIKGAAATIAATGVRDAAAALEQLGCANSLSPAQAAFSRLQKEFEKLGVALSRSKLV
ncbi:MAG: ATP-binding protein [Chitinispirillaceae bacterium]|jgi:PAS domain S-box-containing protein|nr:ATP-binding protein [Chitinispirillaceae bacterium]